MSDQRPLRDALVIMAREPVAGRAKTRLIPALGAEGAAQIFCAFVTDRLSAHQQSHQQTALYIAHTPARAPLLSGLVSRYGPRFKMLQQRGEDLIERMDSIFDTLFDAGHQAVVMTNCDSPQLPLALIDLAFERLSEAEAIVLGPDLGGGYYLVGLNRPCKGLFGAADGKGSSYERTLRFAGSTGRPVYELEAQLDVDRPEDLKALRTLLSQPDSPNLAATRSFLFEESSVTLPRDRSTQ